MGKINSCRVCKSKKLVFLFSLGNMKYSGIFPKKKNNNIPNGRLTLVLCKKCKLVQLDSNFSLNYMYGKNYGYRTSLNKSMVSHILDKKKNLSKYLIKNKKNLIIDIGSNDGTLLNFYSKNNTLIGFDPTIKKFRRFYSKSIVKIDDFFSKKIFKKKFKEKKANLITSIAMFYDLPNPIKFAKDVNYCLSENGVWHFEVSYLPEMLKQLSFDTICHEHLEYYSLSSLKYILDFSNFKIIDLKFNRINGGSIAITAAKKNSIHKENSKQISKILNKEKIIKINDKKTYKKFYQKILKIKKQTLDLINKLKKNNKTVAGYGASTKGNVFLQFCNLNNKHLEYIFEVNVDKKNSFTPGTNIKILLENKKLMSKFDYFLVLPWHFRDFILKKEKFFLSKNKKFIFALPSFKIN